RRPRALFAWVSPGVAFSASNVSAVVSPMQQRLSLAFAAHEIARLAMPLDLADVAAHRLPSPDLATILVGQAAAHVIATIPLEPAARIVGMQPSLVAPDRERLAGVDAEVVERAVAAAVGKLGGGKPAARKFALGVGHVLAAEDAEREHLLGRQLRS